jgi:mRNA-degrading endonuclease toxin of MazEF toxin-antitoxin module
MLRLIGWGAITLHMKDYDGWNSKKKALEERTHVPLFNEREIWWCSLGLNIGYEEDGKHTNFERPICIVKKFNKAVFLGFPLTSTTKDSKYYYPFTLHDTEGSILLSQGRLLSAKRLQRRLGRMSEKEFQQLTDQLKSLLF